MTEIKIVELTQKLYNEDGHSGNVYKKAPPETLRYYENKALEIIGEELGGK